MLVLTVKSAVSDTICSENSNCYIGDRLYLSNGSDATSANCNVTVYNSTNGIFFDGASNVTDNYYYTILNSSVGSYYTIFSCNYTNESAYWVSFTSVIPSSSSVTTINNNGGSAGIVTYNTYYSPDELTIGAGLTPASVFYVFDAFFEKTMFRFSSDKVKYNKARLQERSAEYFTCIGVGDAECAAKDLERIQALYEYVKKFGEKSDYSTFVANFFQANYLLKQDKKLSKELEAVVNEALKTMH